MDGPDIPHGRRERLRENLEARREELCKAVQRELENAGDTRRHDLADRVRGAGAESVASLVADLDLVQFGRLTQEADAVEQALADLQAGRYGVCAGCGRAIALQRLEAEPVTRRCRACQRRREHLQGGQNRPSP